MHQKPIYWQQMQKLNVSNTDFYNKYIAEWNKYFQSRRTRQYGCRITKENDGQGIATVTLGDGLVD